MSRPNTVAKVGFTAGVGIALVAFTMIAGCGGGGAGAKPSAVGTVQVAVAWPAAAAATKTVAPTSIPTGTQSIRVAAIQNGATAANCLVVRPASLGALPNVPCGPTTIIACACQNADGSGDVLAEGSAAVDVHGGANGPISLSLAAIVPVILAQTDFGNADGTNVAPFSTDYASWDETKTLPTYAGTYRVAVNAAGHSWSSGVWAGSDHTNPGTGAFMILDGALESYVRILYYTTSVVAGYTYTWSGWAMEVQGSSIDSMSDLSFRVNGIQQGASLALTNNRIWNHFCFSYTAPVTRTVTFSLSDNNIQWAGNDAGLDDVVLSVAAPPGP
jgi:hypothetical protein